MSLSQVFDRSSAHGSRLITSPCRVAFLDEFRVVVSYHRKPSDAALVIINTLLPQGHPNSVRGFSFPPKYRKLGAWVHLGHDRSLGATDGDGHLIADPSQAILAMSLTPGDDFLVLRTQPLIERACSIHTGVQIPWDDWGRNVVVMTNPTRINSSIPFIHGAHMLVTHKPLNARPNHYQIHAFDFSRRGITTLPLSDGVNGGTERRAEFKDWRTCVFEVGDGMYRRGPIGIGDSIIFYIVSLLRTPLRKVS